jgi:hypothetical protein
MDKVSVSIATNNTVRAQIKQDKMTARIPGVKVIERGGATDYNDLTGKPTLNGVEIIGDKTSEDYGIDNTSDYSMLLNPPKINEHTLTSGENSLASLGIGRASTADINRLF